MKKTFFMIFGGLLMFAMVGCGVSPTQYNDKVVAIHTQASNYLIKVNDILDDEKLSATDKQSMADSLKINIEKWNAQIKALKYPASAKELQGSMVEYFDLLQNEFVPVMQKMLLSTSVDEYNTQLEVYKDVLDKGSKMEDDIEAKQIEFAKKNNMRLY